MLSQTIGFIGAGQMARALAAGFVRQGRITAKHVVAADPVPPALQAFGETVAGAKLTSDNVEVAHAADVVFLATKPQQAASALEPLAAAAAGKLVVSIAAGVTLKSLATWLPKSRLVRVMPNTPCLVGQSASTFSAGSTATEDDVRLVSDLLESVGIAIQVDEKLLDAVTGLSGSGPAFVYVIIEALSDAGVRMGLARDVAMTLAAQTVRGAASMVLETGEHPAVLKDRVASPGGTTIAGLAVLESAGLRGALVSAVEAATKRSIELGQTS